MFIKLDLLGSIFSFLATLFYIRVSEWAWGMTAIATLLNGYLYFVKGIYGDMTVEIVYLFSTIYGWYHWRFGSKQHVTLEITHLGWLHGLLLMLIATITIPALAYLLKTQFNSQVAYMDAFTTILSLQAQWLMCRKVVETWILWFAVDVVYGFLYFSKTLPIHSALYILYVLMAVMGYWHWWRKKNKNPENINAAALEIG